MTAKRKPVDVSALRPARRLTVLIGTVTETPVGTAAKAGLMRNGDVLVPGSDLRHQLNSLPTEEFPKLALSMV